MRKCFIPGSGEYWRPGTAKSTNKHLRSRANAGLETGSGIREFARTQFGQLGGSLAAIDQLLSEVPAIKQ